MSCYRRLLNVSYDDTFTNEDVCRNVQAAVEEFDDLMILVTKRKLRGFGHVSRSSYIAKAILQSTVKEMKR